MEHKSEGKPIQEIGDKVGAKYKTFYDEKLRRIHQAWIPYIQVDGVMMGIYDELTVSGQKEAESKQDALKIARQVRDETKEKLAQKLMQVEEEGT